ncbi:lipid A biosynthesis lauroyl acyltransferase [Lysobacter daejeonensis GH1-9]|uniref:Lipid A biosynthesis lauroyl acyltransferase n=1 Tax=Lysobacter daejeonensis GH1-9 TaxID=1385517 RepID=A0A0A0ERX5_9GAMM|nr:lauroyl acyltransferase [Lysobacter daejeonensis]KGM53259.1 lipid A biosynthesis lauroyl acyltransferase [Lysobacter daejeonensis GH1-9]
MTEFAARLLYLLAAAVARLPWSWLSRLGDALARGVARRDRRESRVTRRNMEIIHPELSASQREALHDAILRTTARQVLETLRLWTRPHAKNLQLLRAQHGVELFDAALASGRGLIVAAPHYGNWELLNQWLAAKTPLAVLYAPPDSKVGEAFLNLVRAAPGSDAERVTQVRADGPAAVRQLLKLLKDGGVVGILPDQQPKRGDGEFAPFFGRPALTMSLLTRLAARTGATVLYAYCERVAEDGSEPAFELHIEPAAPEVASPDPQVAVAALNAGIERIARRDPTQYQWTYKRFSLQPDDANPYSPDCY